MRRLKRNLRSTYQTIYRPFATTQNTREGCFMIKFMAHQLETIEFGLKHPYFIMGLEPGLGKTLTAIELAIRSGAKAVLCIVPAGTRINLKEEILKWYPDKMISCFTDKNQLYKVWDTDFAIISYEMMKHCNYLFGWADHIIFDEAHYLKSSKSQRADLAHRKVYENAYRRCQLLTGTAVENNVVEYYSLMALCYYNPRIPEPKFLKKFPTEIDFALHFSNKKEVRVAGRNTVKFEGLKNKEELWDYLRPIYISKKAKDVLDLPEAVETDIMMADFDNPVLKKAFELFESSGFGESVQSRAKKEAAIATAPFTIEYVKTLLNSGTDKVVIFSDHVDSAHMIAEAFGVKAITGETSAEDRKRTQYNFENCATPQVIVGTTKAMGVAFTLTRSNRLVFNDYPWVPGQKDQAMKRIIRITQKRTPFIDYVHISFQSRYIRQTLEAKSAVIKEIT